MEGQAWHMKKIILINRDKPSHLILLMIDNSFLIKEYIKLTIMSSNEYYDSLQAQHPLSTEDK